jgi:hypothetical protein
MFEGIIKWGKKTKKIRNKKLVKIIQIEKIRIERGKICSK